jgi:hypothetical protein
MRPIAWSTLVLLCSSSRVASAQEVPAPPPVPPDTGGAAVVHAHGPLEPPPPPPADPAAATVVRSQEQRAQMAPPPFAFTTPVNGPAPNLWRPNGAGDTASSARIDPMLPAGIAIVAGAAALGAVGVATLVQAGSSGELCGLSGCLGVPDRDGQNHSAAVLGISAGMAVVGGAAALAGASGPVKHVRKSERRMVTGVVFTSVGVGAAIGSLVEYVAPYAARQHEYGGYGYEHAGYSDGSSNQVASAAMGVSAAAFLAIGIPLWAGGARSRKATADGALATPDVLPSRGGARVRWRF